MNTLYICFVGWEAMSVLIFQFIFLYIYYAISYPAICGAKTANHLTSADAAAVW